MTSKQESSTSQLAENPARIRAMPANVGVLSHGFQNTRDWIVQQGCFSESENLAIYETWFKRGQRYLFRAIDRKYGFRQKRLADVGCSYGVNLLHAVTGSYGIESDPTAANF